ncbi:MAG TPA: minichromosome maintenance protein MCM [archaeon]|nr:minichromosome maintenance protein MCM [archaeon]
MERDKIIEVFSEFIKENYYTQLLNAASEGNKSVEMDFKKLEQTDVELADHLIENPEETLAIFQETLKDIDIPDAKINLRFFGLPESKDIRIRNVRSEHIGKMIVVDGMVKRASEIRPEISESIFECMDCGSRMSIIQTEKIVNYPYECDNPNCGGKKRFKLVDQKLFDARWISVEEPFEITEGERPSTLMIYLKEDLTSPKMQNKTDPGNRIKITGILKNMEKRIKGTQSRQMDIYLEANHVQNLEIEWEELGVKAEDEKMILKLARDPEIYTKLIGSIAPAIYGLEEVKQAVVLQLFSGVSHTQKDKSRVRGDIHILMIGDPSTAKSALMKVVSMLIPRGRYVSGKGVTGAGLTATVVKDEEFLGGWVLEAGALVMCNRSLVAIDEFEKIEKTDLVAMHEALEQQTISIAKASIVATLPAQTSIIAGANPKLGRFDNYMPIREQLDIPETILSRFDLKFALRDIPNLEIDTKMADHILQARHYGEIDIIAPVDATVLRKYVAYARKNCKPKLSREAGNELKRYYLELRVKSAEEGSPISITPRQYEALIRLAEASAKIQLREDVNVEDAIRAINLMKFSLRQFGFDPETGHIDIDRAEGQRMTASQRSKTKIMLDIIEELDAKFGKDIPEEEIIKRANQENVEDVEGIIRKMKNEGLLFTPRHGVVSKA